MDMVKYLSLTTSVLLLTSPLQAIDADLKGLSTQSQWAEEGLSPFDGHSLHSHSHSRGHHKARGPLFLYASTPLDYVGQDVGTAPVPSGTTVQVNFPLIGDTSQVPPVSENTPGIFTVLEKGQYLINWTTLVKNFDMGGFNASFELVLLQNGIRQPPNQIYNIPPVFGKDNNPSGEALSGSILLKLAVGDTVQLDITSFSSSALTTPLVVEAASINFIRISPN